MSASNNPVTLARTGPSRAAVPIGRALISGTLAGLASAATLALLARAEGRRPSQPLNATSHWLWGERAGAVAGTDIRHTAVGLATHQASAVFWAVLFEALAGRRRGSAPRLLGRAGLTAAVAALVDYGLMPRRLTPGWELVLSRESIAGAYVALGFGLAAGALIRRRRS